MLLLLLVAVVLLPAVYCHPHSNYHPTSNYYSCAFQNAVAAVGGSGDVAYDALPSPSLTTILVRFRMLLLLLVAVVLLPAVYCQAPAPRIPSFYCKRLKIDCEKREDRNHE